MGPTFDPFTHKLVLRTMADYLQEIEDAKSEVARLKGEKEAFEQSNPPDDADEEELEKWNYAKDLDQHIKDLKSENRDALSHLKKLAKTAAKKKATADDKSKFADAQAVLQSVFDEIARIEALFAPYEQIKAGLSAARARFRDLTTKFVEELKARCEALSDDLKQQLVLELFAQDVQIGLDAAVGAKRQSLVHFVERLWDRYAVPLSVIQHERKQLQTSVAAMMEKLRYT